MKKNESISTQIQKYMYIHINMHLYTYIHKYTHTCIYSCNDIPV